MTFGPIGFIALFAGISMSLTAFFSARDIMKNNRSWQGMMGALLLWSWDFKWFMAHVYWFVVYAHLGVISFLVVMNRIGVDGVTGVVSEVPASGDQDGLWVGILSVLIVLWVQMATLPAPLFKFHSFGGQVIHAFFTFLGAGAVFVMLAIFGNVSGPILAAIILSGILTLALLVFFGFTVKWYRDELFTRMIDHYYFRQVTLDTPDEFYQLKQYLSVGYGHDTAGFANYPRGGAPLGPPRGPPMPWGGGFDARYATGKAPSANTAAAATVAPGQTYAAAQQYAQQQQQQQQQLQPQQQQQGVYRPQSRVIPAAAASTLARNRGRGSFVP